MDTVTPPYGGIQPYLVTAHELRCGRNAGTPGQEDGLWKLSLL